MKKRLRREEIRIQENHIGTLAVWDMWGPYVAERAWGTVREDYSEDGDAWNHYTYDMIRSRVPRWGEDGIAGICDRYQIATLSFAFWNHKDPHLKERLFGLTPDQANHGEDVKEMYFYLDNVPSHAYMKYLYKYPQNEFPYQQLIDENGKRSAGDPEYEIYDTGIFAEKRYFDIFIEYAKMNIDDIVVKVEAVNKGPDDAVIDLIPQLTFRNVWSWDKETPPKPKMWAGEKTDAYQTIEFDDDGSSPFPMLDVDYALGKYYLYASPDGERYFTENETDLESLKVGTNTSPYVRDAFHRKIVSREDDAINPKQEGTRACIHFKDLKVPSGGSVVRYLRISKTPLHGPLTNIEDVIKQRKYEADQFYNHILENTESEEEKQIQRTAIAGTLWTRQLYLFIANYWIKGDEIEFPGCRTKEIVRNTKWAHLVCKHIITMPDKWEYPWFAAWDLAFHAVTIGLYDLALAKDQLSLLLTEQFQHPSGQIPAYEWEFSDLNPPIQAVCLLRLYMMEKEMKGVGDLDFLQKSFEKLVINFVWWVNREDSLGNNIFEGGFLGLDNIGVLDRSKPIPGGGIIEQSDGTGWMGLFCLSMMRIAVELSKENRNYEPMVTKFFQHFVYIAAALNNSPNRDVQNWDEEDGFFYDVLCYGDGKHEKIAVRSVVGVIPLFAIDAFTEEELHSLPEFFEKFEWFHENRKDLLENCVNQIEENGQKKYVISLVPLDKIGRVYKRICDEEEFKSEYGLRSLSKIHEKEPYRLFDAEVKYIPGESNISMYGGNSNWRGPIWFPINFALTQNLMRMSMVLGKNFELDFGDGQKKDLDSIRKTFSESLISLFKKDENGNRPIYKDIKHADELELDRYILFYEYFHGDSGKGLGASHQTGWTALIANIIQELRYKPPEL